MKEETVKLDKSQFRLLDKSQFMHFILSGWFRHVRFTCAKIMWVLVSMSETLVKD